MIAPTTSTAQDRERMQKFGKCSQYGNAPNAIRDRVARLRATEYCYTECDIKPPRSPKP